MIIDAFLTPTNSESEDQFGDSIVLMIDVLRASTTVAAALSNGARELIVFESLEKAVRLYNTLSKGGAVLGGERGGVKPSGFDAGNSPFDYTGELVKDKTVILTTTNGTIVFQNAKHAKVRIIAGFVNINAVLDYVRNLLTKENPPSTIKILAAGNKGKLSYEDTICAGAYIHHLSTADDTLTDSAAIARDLYIQHSDDMFNFLKKSEHSKKLTELGFSKDIDLAFNVDAFPVVPVITGNSVKIAVIQE